MLVTLAAWSDCVLAVLDHDSVNPCLAWARSPGQSQARSGRPEGPIGNAGHPSDSLIKWCRGAIAGFGPPYEEMRCRIAAASCRFGAPSLRMLLIGAASGNRTRDLRITSAIKQHP